METVARPYVITIKTVHPKTGHIELHECRVSGYTLQEALFSAGLELDGRLNLTEQGYTMKVVVARPDDEKARTEMAGLLEQIRLAIADVGLDVNG